MAKGATTARPFLITRGGVHENFSTNNNVFHLHVAPDRPLNQGTARGLT